MTDRRDLAHDEPTAPGIRHSPGRPYAYAARRAGELFTMCPWCWHLHSHGSAAVVGDPFIDSRMAHCRARPRPGMYVLTTDPALFGQECADYPPERIDAERLPARDLEALGALKLPIGSPDPRPALAAARSGEPEVLLDPVEVAP